MDDLLNTDHLAGFGGFCMKQSSMNSKKLNKIMNVVAVALMLATIAALFFLKDIPVPGIVPDTGVSRQRTRGKPRVMCQMLHLRALLLRKTQCLPVGSL